MPLAEGVLLFQGVHRFRPEVAGQLIPLGEFKFESPSTLLVMQTVQGGTILHREFHPAAELIYKPGHDFFRHADRLHVIPLIDASSDSEMTSLCVDDGALAGLIGEDLTQRLIAGLGLNPPPMVKVMPIPLHVSAPLRASLSPTLTGALKKLFAQAKVLEYLCGLAVHVCAQSTLKLKTDHKRETVRELHDYLMQMEGKLPTLEELTVRCGISARWLNDAFAQEYGQTIYSFSTDTRLTESHVALLEGNLPIKTISARLGYSHVNHFSIAFKKKFGYPPGSLRTKQQGSNRDKSDD
jgi:AraC-like DNA-binding protein